MSCDIAHKSRVREGESTRVAPMLVGRDGEVNIRRSAEISVTVVAMDMEETEHKPTLANT